MSALPSHTLLLIRSPAQNAPPPPLIPPPHTPAAQRPPEPRRSGQSQMLSTPASDSYCVCIEKRGEE